MSHESRKDKKNLEKEEKRLRRKEKKRLRRAERAKRHEEKRNPIPVTIQEKIVPSIVDKVLLIGINYTGTSNELDGCINDSQNLGNRLIQLGRYKAEDITYMNDKRVNTIYYPSKQNILNQLESLVQLALKNPFSQIRFFVGYSGHGSYLSDKNSDEVDKKDEVICPIDLVILKNKIAVKNRRIDFLYININASNVNIWLRPLSHI